MTEFRTASTPLAAMHRHRTAAGAQALPEAQFTDLISELTAAGLLVRFDEHDLGGRENRDARRMFAFYMRFSHAVDAACATHHTSEQERERSDGTSRVPIIPIDDRGNPTPLALGMILAHVMAHKDGMLNEHYQLVPEWLTREARTRPRGSARHVSLLELHMVAWAQPLVLGAGEAQQPVQPHDPRRARHAEVRR